MDKDFWVQLSKHLFHHHSDGFLGQLVVVGISLCSGHSDQSSWLVPALPTTATPCQAGYDYYPGAWFWDPLEGFFPLHALNVHLLYVPSVVLLQAKSREIQLHEYLKCRNISTSLPFSVSSVKKLIKFMHREKFYFIFVLPLGLSFTLHVLYFNVVALWHSVLQSSRCPLDDFLSGRPLELFHLGFC